MDWIFLKHLWFYGILGLVSVIPIVSLIQALLKVRFKIALDRTRQFLNDWAGFAPQNFWKVVGNTVGASGLLFLLALFAYTMNRFGDVTMPVVSRRVGHLDNPVVAWSIDHENEWKRIKYEYREVTGIKGDRHKWEDSKAKLGKFGVRLFRTTIYLCLLMSIAGVVDVVRSTEFRKRGLAVTVVGVVGTVMSLVLWVDRQERYVDNLVSGYRSVYFEQNGSEPSMPESYRKMVESKLP